MSRIGKHPVAIPGGVDAKVAGGKLVIKGKLGQLEAAISDAVKVEVKDGAISVQPANDSIAARQQWGTYRSIIANLVEGVTQGFSKTLEIQGVGFRAALQGKDLVLQLGFSHEVRYKQPAGITFACPKPTEITITGADKQQVGQVAAEIRAFRRPEPYKGKGIRYTGEFVRRKEGKKK